MKTTYDLQGFHISMQNLKEMENLIGTSRAKKLLDDIVAELNAKRAFSGSSGFGEQLILEKGFIMGYLAAHTTNHIGDEE